MDTILYFQPKAMPYVVPDKFAGVREIASRHCLHVQVVDGEPTARLVAELADFWHVCGAVVECGSRTTAVDLAAFGTLPVVLLSPLPGQRPAPTLSVSHDSVATARMAARELLATGFSHFAFVPYPEPRYWNRVRERTFAEAIRMHGKTFQAFRAKAPVGVMAGDIFPTSWQTELRRFIARLPKPCGVFAANDRVGEEVLIAARFAGAEVPGDIAVLGVDNDERVCERCDPPLSSIAPDFRRSGMLAAELVFEATAKGGAQPGHRRFSFGPLRVAYRESMRRQAVSDKCVADALALITREACAGLRAADVAARFPCSRRLACLRFRKATGRTIREEIHAVRLETARRLLETTDMPFKALSDFCGFKNPNSLRKFFRRETGTTLRAWRVAQARADAATTGSPGRRHGTSIAMR